MESFMTNAGLLIRIVEPKNELASGIVIPDKALQKPQWGWVVDVGEGLSDVTGHVWKPDFKPGELVYFMQSAPEKFDYTPEGLGVLHAISEGDVYLKVKFAADGNVTLLPMGNYIHIQPIEDSVKRITEGGIHLPDQVLDRPSRAKVLSVGPGQRTASGMYPPRVSPGDVVRYRPHTPYQIKFDDMGIKDTNQFIIAYGDIVMIETDNYIEVLKKRLDNLGDNNENQRNRKESD